MIMIRCIAIDDEPLALQQLERFLQRIPELELIGTYYSADDAQPLIADGKADVIFLDIDMPDCNGVDFAAVWVPAPLLWYSRPPIRNMPPKGSGLMPWITC